MGNAPAGVLRRRARRKIAKVKGLDTAEGRRPFARLGGKSGTGIHWMAQVKARKAAEEALRGMATMALAPECSAVTPALAADFPNVWLLSQATYPALSGVSGIGPAKLRIVKDYLEVKGVDVAWEVQI